MIDDPITADYLFSACSTIASGQVPESILKLLSAARLIALPKASGDVRPIAIGEVLRRIPARTICSQLKVLFATSLLLYSMGLQQMVEWIFCCTMFKWLESNDGWVVLKTDAKNAFNSVNRLHLLKQVSVNFPSIFNHVCQMYSGVGPLIFLQQNGPVILSSQEGIHQGDPLGPVLFSIAVHQALLDLQTDNPGVQVLAYLDDVFLVGPSSSVLSAFDQLKPAFQKIGLDIQEQKCELYEPTPSEDMSASPTHHSCHF